MSWVGRVTRRRLALSKSGAGSSGKKNLAKSRDQTKHVTRGIEHVGKDGAKGNLEQISHSGSHWRLGRKKYSKSGVLNALLRTFVGIESRQRLPKRRGFDAVGRSKSGAIKPRDEGVDPGDA